MDERTVKEVAARVALAERYGRPSTDDGGWRRNGCSRSRPCWSSERAERHRAGESRARPPNAAVGLGVHWRAGARGNPGILGVVGNGESVGYGVLV